MLIQQVSSIAANSQTDDLLVNNIQAISRGNYVVYWGVTASATGLLVTVFVGTMAIAPEFAPSLQNRFPLDPDDMLGRFGVVFGDRIVMRVRNTTGGALNLFQKLQFSPVPRMR